MEEYTTMGQISAALGELRQKIDAEAQRNQDRREIDDIRDREAKDRQNHLLDRIDGHGGRIKTLEINWLTFFSDVGAFTYVRKKIESTDLQNKWIIALIITTLIGVITNLATKH